MAGIKETKEAIIAAGLLAKEVKKAKADGKLDLKDVVAFIQSLQANPEMAALLMAGLDNISGVADEVTDLNWMEGYELVKVAIDAFKP